MPVFAFFALLRSVAWGLLVRLGNLTALLPALFTFFATPLGRVVLMGVAGLGLFIAGDFRGRAACDARVAHMMEQSKEEARARDDKIKQQVQREATASLQSLEKLNADLARKVSAYEQEIAKRGGNTCKLSPRDLERLRKL